jgi:hypothetical protein
VGKTQGNLLHPTSERYLKITSSLFQMEYENPPSGRFGIIAVVISAFLILASIVHIVIEKGSPAKTVLQNQTDAAMPTFLKSPAANQTAKYSTTECTGDICPQNIARYCKNASTACANIIYSKCAIPGVLDENCTTIKNTDCTECEGSCRNGICQPKTDVPANDG